MSFSTAHHPRRGVKDWVELMLKDHGFLRLGWHNLHEIRPGVWRANQPAPKDVRQVAKLGIKTIVNLRGPRSDGGWRLEKEACDKAGITLVDFTVRSRAVPDYEVLRGAKEMFQAIEYPMMMHCKSGADRAGIMSALYLLLMENATVDEALEMLSLKYLHVKQAKTGLLDAFIEAYRPAQDAGKSMLDWAKQDLNPQQLHDEFMAQGWAVRLVDDILKRE